MPKKTKEPRRLDCFPLSCRFGETCYFPQRYLACLLTLYMGTCIFMNRALFNFIVPYIAHQIESDTNKERPCPPREPLLTRPGRNSGVFCNMNGVIAGWMPQHERGRLGLILFCSPQLGSCIGFFLPGLLLDITGNWRIPFYIFGFISALCATLYAIFVHSTYDMHPFITDKEFKYLQENLPSVKQTKKKLPCGAILRSGPFWVILLMCNVYDFAYFTLNNELAKYMRNMLGFSSWESSVFTSVPYGTTIICGFVLGNVSDYVLKKELVSLTVIRKIYVAIGVLSPAFWGFLAVFVACNERIVIVCITFGIAGMACFTACWTNITDIAPALTSFLTAIANATAACQGFISSEVIAAILGKTPTFGKYQIHFGITLVLAIVMTTFYILFGTSERQQWDIDASAEQPTEETKADKEKPK